MYKTLLFKAFLLSEFNITIEYFVKPLSPEKINIKIV